MMVAKPVKDWTHFRLLPRSGRGSQYEAPICKLCGEAIKVGQYYYDGGFGKRAHKLCAETERKK